MPSPFLTLSLDFATLHSDWVVMKCYFAAGKGDTSDFLFEPIPSYTKAYPNMSIKGCNIHCRICKHGQ